MNIKALNEPELTSSSSGESLQEDNRQQTLSKEALQEQRFDKYRKALIAIHDLNQEYAKDLLDELNSELEDFDSDDETLSQLRFSVLKNLGNLKTNGVDDYINALAIDRSDISLWIKTGDRAMRLSNFAFARVCYEEALSLNPSNWVAIDRLMEIYYILHLPFELFDVCMKALSVNPTYDKARELIEEAKKLQPVLCNSNGLVLSNGASSKNPIQGKLIQPLNIIKNKRRCRIQDELQKFKRARLGITLDTARTQSLASFGGYIIKIYERFSKQCITRNTVIDIVLNNSLSFTQQITNNSVNSQSINQNSNEPNSQDIEMSIEGDGTSVSDNDKSDNRNEPTTSNDDIDQTKSNSRNRLNQTFQKSSSLSFAAMLFPMDIGDKRRSSRNRSNQDDTFSFKMKFDEINELFPESLRIGAIEQALRKKHEEQQRHQDEREKEKKAEAIPVETNLEPVREDLIIKDIIEAISERLQATSSSNSKNDIKLCDLFYLYLSKLSMKKQNSLPEVFPKIYKVYRKLCPLPTSAFVDIGADGITLDELWFTLTANEVSYNHQECLFLLRILEQLKIYIDEYQHKEFLVRLFSVLGSNSDHRYLQVALENIGEDMKVYASNRKIITRAHLKTLIDRTTEKLSHENDHPDDSLELIEKLAPKSENEMSDREINSLCAAIKSTGVWQRGLDILNQRNDLNNDIIIETLNTCLQNGAKMDAILASKLCKEAISGSRPQTWSCLYYGWTGILTEDELYEDEMIERLDKFFEIGHQTLGKKCVCTTDNGEFLMLYVKHLLMDEHDGYEERELLGSLSCLFNFPNKKPTSVIAHKAQRVPMQWKYAEIIYNYLLPETMPTYMCLLRKRGISSEQEPLFKEIALSVPDALHPSRTGNAADSVKDFIERGKPLTTVNFQANEVTKNTFYLLADYYFKNKLFDKAKTYYYHDIAINPDRFDSWAASGLILANGVDKALSEGTVTTEDFVEGSFRNLSDSAIRCFEQATLLNPNEEKATLWIEFGNLTYNLVSLASRLFCYDDFEHEIDGKDPPDTSKIEARHKYLYKLAKNCFKSAISLCHSEEVWLQYYMLGKIYEKVNPIKALEYYYKADAQLFHEGASYPKKILYHNPPELAFEAMEVHYRIHSCSLKYLLLSEDISQENMNLLKRYLLNAQRSPFVELEGAPAPKTQMTMSVEKDVGLLLNDLVELVDQDAEFDELIFMCLHGMKRCLARSDKNFKALYRLSYYYKKIRDPTMSQDILWAPALRTDRRIANLLSIRPGIPDFQAAPPDLRGHDSLFKDRKIGNIFFNVWRIPIEEIDRPGCFEHWMFKCTLLLIKICMDLNDTNVLNIIAFQLSRQPETSKKYLQDRPRVLMGRYAAKAIANIVFDAISRTENIDQKRALIKEGMNLADKYIKSNVFADRMQVVYNQLRAKAFECQ